MIEKMDYIGHIETAKRVISIEIQGMEALKDKLDEKFAEAVDAILAISGRVVVSGIGKSGHIARKIASTMASTGTPALFLHPAEASHGDLGMLTMHDIVILISNSGETQELLHIIDYCKRFNIAIIGITSNANSLLFQHSNFPLLLPTSQEASPLNAPTTSTTMMMALGDALAIALHSWRKFTHHDFKVYHPGGNIGAKLLALNDIMHKNSELPLISSLHTAFEAMLEITSKRFGCVGVIDEAGKLMGIVTDGDLRRHIDIDMHKAKVLDIMTDNPVTAHSALFASEALNIMQTKKITQLFVIDEQSSPIGIVHIHDLLNVGVI